MSQSWLQGFTYDQQRTFYTVHNRILTGLPHEWCILRSKQFLSLCSYGNQQSRQALLIRTVRILNSCREYFKLACISKGPSVEHFVCNVTAIQHLILYSYRRLSHNISHSLLSSSCSSVLYSSTPLVHMCPR